MIRTLYEWTMSLAAHPRALWALGIVAFVEASVFPIPPDVLMIAMIVATPTRAFRIAAVATLGSVLGGMLGYAIGWGLYDSVGRPVLEFYGKTAYFEEFSQRYNEWGAWMVLIAGVTPFPYKVITILSGLTQLSLPVFIVSSIVARAGRFFLVAWLLHRYGATIREFIERRLGLMTILFFVILGVGFWAVRFL